MTFIRLLSLLFTGGQRQGRVHRWDLRYAQCGPSQEYRLPAHYTNYLVHSLAVDPCHGTLLSGGWRNIECWNLETGAIRYTSHIAMRGLMCDS
jgi:hypothetical protein